MKFSTHTTRQLAQAIALAVVVAGLAVPAAAAGSGQLTDVFSRAVARHQAQALADVFERYVASHPYGAGLAPVTLPAGEAKNETPFTRAAISSSAAFGLSLGTGEAKNQAPFTRSATRQPQTIAVHSSSGFRWADAAIGAAAAIALALAGAAMFARTARTHESSPAH